MDEDTAKKVVDFIFDSPSKDITIEFQGGEPLLKFDLIKSVVGYAQEVNKIKRKRLLFTVVTNFSLMDDEKMRFFIDNKVALCTSLDGPEELHNHNRKFGGGNSYEKVVDWIKKVDDEYAKGGVDHPGINALVTITQKSLGYSKEIIDEYVANGLMSLHLRFLNNLGDARTTWEDISYSPEEFIEFWKKSMDYILELNLAGKIVGERGTVIILKKLLDEHDPNYLDMRSPCGACIGQMTYTPNGDVFSCDEARMLNEDLFKLGNVGNDSLRNVLGCDKTCAIVSSSVNDAHICDACAYKPYCGICPVCNYAEQGSLVAKIPETARCRVFKAQFDYLFEKLQSKENREIFEKWLEKP
jgi:His-Xaa-Ser system radical SAM maturase HxsB